MEENIIGPALPPLKSNENEASLGATEVNEVCQESDSEYYGPQLPPHLQNRTSKNTKNAESTSTQDYKDEVYGPVPADAATNSKVQKSLEERALEIKLGYCQLEKEDVKKREEWMLELPEVGKQLGLGPRNFRKNGTVGVSSDRSCWTETPTSKNKSSKQTDKDILEETKLKEIRKRDKEQEKMAKKHNKKRKRDKSLYEIHQEKLKKKEEKNKDADSTTRRPFNREIDLKVNHFDEAQKKAILKKAQHLDDRFSAGQAKYL